MVLLNKLHLNNILCICYIFAFIFLSQPLGGITEENEAVAEDPDAHSEVLNGFGISTDEVAEFRQVEGENVLTRKISLKYLEPAFVTKLKTTCPTTEADNSADIKCSFHEKHVIFHTNSAEPLDKTKYGLVSITKQIIIEPFQNGDLEICTLTGLNKETYATLSIVTDSKNESNSHAKVDETPEFIYVMLTRQDDDPDLRYNPAEPKNSDLNECVLEILAGISVENVAEKCFFECKKTKENIETENHDTVNHTQSHSEL